MSKEHSADTHTEDKPDLAGERGAHKIYLLRHPQTQGNVLGRYQGWQESPLSENGNLQKLNTVAAYTEIDIKHVITSPLSRCRDLASEISSNKEIPLMVDDRLKEIGFGDLEGITYAEAQQQGIKMFWEIENANRFAPNGETFLNFETRLASITDQLLTITHDTLLVTHGGVIRGLLTKWFDLSNKSFFQLRVDNVSTAVVSFVDNVAVLESFGLTPGGTSEMYSVEPGVK